MRKIVNTVSSILLIVLILLTVLLFGAKLIGYKPYAVLSGSMTPEYSVGSVVYVKSCSPEEIRINDVITFMKNETTVVTHRVVAIDNSDNELRFVTKGDANTDIDVGTVHEKNIIGRVSFSIPLMGYVSDFISNPPGCYIAGIVVIVLLFITFLPDLLFSGKSNNDNSTDK